jgi:Tfp pilus assembly protein PilF
MQNQKVQNAYKNWLWIIKENPMFVQAYSNLGFLKLQQRQLDSAFYYLQKGRHIDHDNEMLLLNTLSYYLQTNDKLNAKKLAQEILIKHPTNIQAKQILQYLQ